MTECQQSLTSLLALIMLLFAPLTASSNPFEKLEQQFLDSEGINLAFEISSEGAVKSALTGRLALCKGNRIKLQSSGDLFGQPVNNSLQSDGQVMNLNQQQQNLPSKLNEAVVVGLLRMGLLHNLARLGGNLAPDHAGGGVADWVQVPVVRVNSDNLFFDILVAGTRAGKAELVLSDDGLPLTREQIVYFGSEQMNVTESYTDLSLSCRL
jgi:hypothetical protein